MAVKKSVATIYIDISEIQARAYRAGGRHLSGMELSEFCFQLPNEEIFADMLDSSSDFLRCLIKMGDEANKVSNDF